MSAAPRRLTRNPAAGFSLVEVMVALIIIAVGLLGIAKMQALAYSSTSVAAMRSLAAIEASSMASSMQANRGYWAAITAASPLSLTITGAAVATSTDAALTSVATDCAAATCAPDVLAAYDLAQWAMDLQALLPNDTAAIDCSRTSALPVSCTVTISWAENAVAVNGQGVSASGATTGLYVPTYQLNVDP